MHISRRSAKRPGDPDPKPRVYEHELHAANIKHQLDNQHCVMLPIHTQVLTFPISAAKRPLKCSLYLITGPLLGW